MKTLPEYDVILNDEPNWFTEAIEEAEKKEKEDNNEKSQTTWSCNDYW